jgi:asparagine synthase (glutamine-hydrolysing)
MCGISGFWQMVGGEQAMAARIRAMSDALIHRGPGDGDVWTEPGAGMALGHRRLAIIDLSSAGRQPMISDSGQLVMVFNGEIYNFKALRAELEAQGGAPTGGWHGHSDSEVLLAGIAHWGLVETLRRAIGMFALALWDRRARRLSLARDRLGEKPLYYGFQRNGGEQALLFGSELKALRRHPAFAGGVDRRALTLYLRHAYVPAPLSIHPGIVKLMPGTIAHFDKADAPPQIETWWSLAQVARAGAAAPFTGSPEEAAAQVAHLASRAVERQMVADVPLGAFLSGGIDSSCVVALMQAQATRPVKTFTIGFESRGFDEAPYARAVAAHLGTDHHELYVSASDARAVIPDIAQIWCEPFADSSQLPTLLVSAMARRQVTVALSGDGGDELFAGYTRYGMTERLWAHLDALPLALRQVVAAGSRAVPPGWGNALGRLLSGGKIALAGDRLHKGAGMLGAASIEDVYLRMVSTEPNPSSWVVDGGEGESRLAVLRGELDTLAPVSVMMALDAQTYLPDDILVKVDRAAMAVSLETRMPLLDAPLVEFALSLPLGCKLRDGVSKWPLRRLLDDHVPRQLIERPKMGFGMPIGQWLRGPLRDWAESLLAAPRLAAQGYWHPAPVRAAWAEHLSGRRNFTASLWSVLMFQAWLEAWDAG